MYKYPIRSDEIYHYGIKRRSGRYPWGSGNRPYQSMEKGKLKIKEIYEQLSEDERSYLGSSDLSKYTKYIKVIGDSYITLDDYNGKFKDEHPFDGYIVSIASGKKDRGSGNTDKLIKIASEENSDKPLIAEIDKDNEFSKRLFERNGFYKIDEFDGLMFYKKDQEVYTKNKEKNEYGVELLKNAEKRNLDKFGSDKKHNILYIDGISGSGKSTLALFLKEPNDQVIHLDSYFERKNVKEARNNRNHAFNVFLKENGFEPSVLENDKLFKENIKEYFNEVDRFVKLSEQFGEKSFENNQRVIMEGIQIGDETLYLDKSFYKDKPFIHLTTDAETSKQRAKERDLKHSQEGGVKFKMNNYYLIHGGPGSGRYPLGSGERPYQKFEKSRRKSSGGIAEYIRSRKAKKEEKKALKEMSEYEERQKIEEKKEQDLKKNKERLLKSASASEVMEYQGRLTNNELEYISTRLKLEDNIKGYASKDLKSNLDRLNRVEAYAKASSKLAEDGISLWNSMAVIYNTTPNGQKSPLPIIGNQNQDTGGKRKKK